MTIDVSIIIPAFNEEKDIADCLESLRRLDYPPKKLEVIIVDNGSSDATRKIAKSFNAVVLRDDIKTVSGLRNLGVRYAKGKILAFVDADCVVSENWLKASSKYFGKADIVAWGSPPRLPDNSSWVQKTWYMVRKKDRTVQIVDWLESMNFFVRKDQFLRVGGFNEHLVTCEDVDLSYRLANLGKIISDDNISVVHTGEAKTLIDFIKKEIWRGQGNFYGVTSHGFKLNEIPSLAIPIIFGFICPLFYIGALLTQNLLWLMILAFFSMLPTIRVIIKTYSKGSLGDLIKLIYLMQAYYFARTIAILQ